MDTKYLINLTAITSTLRNLLNRFVGSLLNSFFLLGGKPVRKLPLEKREDGYEDVNRTDVAQFHSYW
jgi:hypothetical protein